MGTIGGIRLESSTPGVTSTGPLEGFNNPNSYTFDIDLSVVPTYTLTGNFDAIEGSESNYSASIPLAVGTFSIDATDGTFSYTVTQAEAISGGVPSITFSVTGTDDNRGFGDEIDSDNITFNFTVCFAGGTQISGPDGERAVQDLRIGDLITTADGRSVPVKWIGRTSIHPMFNPADRLEPVLIRQNAFGPDLPHSDLVVTADHGMVLDGLVITAGALVNGTTIDWLPWKHLGQSLTYYHIETDQHDVILANGAASETYVDYVARSSFDNFAEYLALYGTETTIHELPMPRISSARMVPANLRARLGGVLRRPAQPHRA